MSANVILPIELTTFNSANLTANYQAINPNGLDASCIILRINNSGSSAVTISFDGVTNHEYLAAGQSVIIESQANSLPSSKVCCFRKGMVVYLKGTAGTGTLSLSGYYQQLGR
jgi:hypothetical protein